MRVWVRVCVYIRGGGEKTTTRLQYEPVKKQTADISRLCKSVFHLNGLTLVQVKDKVL